MKTFYYFDVDKLINLATAKGLLIYGHHTKQNPTLYNLLTTNGIDCATYHRLLSRQILNPRLSTCAIIAFSLSCKIDDFTTLSK